MVVFILRNSSGHSVWIGFFLPSIFPDFFFGVLVYLLDINLEGEVWGFFDVLFFLKGENPFFALETFESRIR